MENTKNDKEPHVPEWLKVVQVNSWEAELLISALLLYMLFQVPAVIDTYRDQHYERGELLYLAFGIFITALKVLRIGYSLHIIARGIWVASVGLSYIYPKSLDQDKLKFKGKFKEEIAHDQALDKTIKSLEKVASLSYAVSFMISGMVISVGLLLLYFMMYQEWVLQPSVASDNRLYITLSMMGMMLYFMILFIIFIDFVTNGVFRRESWAAKPYYYIALLFRFLTLSFIYNRIQLTIISNLPKWQGHAVPILAILSIVGYMFIENKIDDWQVEDYLNAPTTDMKRMNYESMRRQDDPMFATIQDDVIDGALIELYVQTHGMMSGLYRKDTSYTTKWKELSNMEQARYAEKYLEVTLDGKTLDTLQWLDFQHPTTFGDGFMNYIDVKNIKEGLHTISVVLDTARFNDLQKKLVRDHDPYFVKLASIQFYKSP